MSCSLMDFFSCVTLYAPRAMFGALTGSTLLGRVSSMRRRINWVRPWRGLFWPQTTIDAPSIDDLLAPTS